MKAKSQKYPEQKEQHFTFGSHPKKEMFKKCTQEYFHRHKNVYLDNFELERYCEYLDTLGFMVFQVTSK